VPIKGVAHRERTLPFDVLFGWRVVRVTSDYVVQRGDGVILVDTTQHSVRVELPAISTISLGVTVKKIDNSGNVVSIVPAGVEKANGLAVPFVLSIPLESLAIVPELSLGWWAVGTT